MYQVILERDDCTMCGHCVEIDETKFNFDEDDRAMIIGAQREDNVDELTVEESEIYEEAEENCTGQCIEVFEED
ncbi:MAG: ferredoxin [Methanosphaera sp. rholeuAM6]|nr:MAG: ferredoxin [Methanosphaera sp. rholeuAM6]